MGTDTTAENYLDAWPQIFPQADQYSKVFYSSILADLGNPGSENVLTDPVLLGNWTSDFKPLSKEDWTWEYMGPAFSPYDPQADPGSPLNITPSTIYAEYFCQKPVRKPAGALIVAIFIADLVFLSALWRVLSWGTTAWVEQSHSQSNYCEGCLAIMAKDQELGSLSHAVDTSYAPGDTLKRPVLGSVRGRHATSESQVPLVRSPEFI